jgi:hypothetical protein
MYGEDEERKERFAMEFYSLASKCWGKNGEYRQE